MARKQRAEPEPDRVKGQDSDIALYDSMLADSKAEALADVLAVKRALSRGVSLKDAIELYASSAAVDLLAGEGLLVIDI